MDDFDFNTDWFDLVMAGSNLITYGSGAPLVYALLTQKKFT